MVPSKSIIKKDGFSIRVLIIVIWNLEKWKRQWSKIVLSTVVNQTFWKTKFLIGKSDFVHIMYFDKPNVWYLWSLKLLAIKKWFPFKFTKNLQGRHFVVGGPKSFELLSNISFDNGFQKMLLSWSRRYSMKWSSNFDGS